jgi:replicative DNA helicase
MLTPLPFPQPSVDDGLQRSPPHNFEAEQALLGAILMNNRALERVSEFLRPEHFADPVHGVIYDACLALTLRNQIATPVTLKTYLANHQGLKDLGGDSYLVRLAGAAATIINAEDYGRLVFDLHLRRALIGVGEDMVNDAFEADLERDAVAQIEIAEHKLFDLATTGQVEGGFKDFKTTLKAAINQAEAAHKREGKLSGVTSGLRDLDQKLGGLHASDLLILAGRPSMGKTALATNIAFNAAKALRYETSPTGEKKVVEGAVTAFFSLEMSAEQLATRILAERAEVASHKIRQGELSNEEFERLVIASQELYNLPLYIDDTPALSVSAVRTRARRLKRTSGLGMVVIDYLQLLTATPGKRVENRVQEVSDITRQLKALAKDLEVPVLALSQLSRSVEQREDKRPQLSDLRESGSIEQDADVVMFVYREQYYLERAEPSRRAEEAEEKFNARHAEWQTRCNDVWNTAEVIVAKQRHGPVGNVRLFFDGQYTRFADLDEFHGTEHSSE